MTEIDTLTYLERGILEFCCIKKITKETLTIKFKNISKEAREAAIVKLLALGYLKQIKVINQQTGRPRTLFYTTDFGKIFLKEFHEWLAST